MGGTGDIHEILRRVWGYEGFRPLQEEVIRSVLGGRDTLALMPTGGGKSLLYEVSGLAMEGMCLVVSPLIALMKDQVEDLRRRGVAAEAVFTGLERGEVESRLNKCEGGGVKFLYVSPERLASGRFRERLRRMRVCLVAVDEAHCISQWGYDFRPSYLRIAEVRAFFPGVAVLALTATATPAVVADIQRQLGFREENVMRTSFRRGNLSYVARRTTERVGELCRVLRGVGGASIVYGRTRETVEELARELRKRGFVADFYHAGLSARRRAERQEAWREGRVPVMVATNAFGMGIDKGDVRVVVHFDIPDGPEAYFQEAGRAGRDGRRAYAVLLWNGGTLAGLRRRVETDFPGRDYVRRVYEALGDFFQVGVGEGQGRVFEFDVERFARVFKLDEGKVMASLDILRICGYLECTTEVNARGRVVFTVERDELYERETGGELEERVLVLLMRRYEGVFTREAYVDEGALAEELGVTRGELYEALVGLNRRRLIRYVPGDDKAYVVYYERRLPGRDVLLSREAYDVRRAVLEGRVEGMARYVERDDECRQLQLTRYFGQEETEPCGICDVCLARRRKGRESGGTREGVLRVLGETGEMGGGMEVEVLARRLGVGREEVLAVARELVGEGRVCWVGRRLAMAGGSDAGTVAEEVDV